MTREQAIRHACTTVGLAYHSVGNYDEASDGFCDQCSAKGLNFDNAGHALAYVRQAVIEKLQRDGHKLADFVKLDD